MAASFAVLLVAAPAGAYSTTGCKWPAKSIRVDTRYTNGVFATGITAALKNYSDATDLTMSGTNSSGPTFTAANALYGKTGWEGYTTWACPFGVTTGADSKLNQTYLGSAPAAQTKVVWLHELGHGLGLDHVSSSKAVMYKSASDAYGNGVRSLTSDEVKGINALY